MKRILLTTVLALMTSLLMVESAVAQRRGRYTRPRLRAYQRPALNPYMDLLSNQRGSTGNRSFGFEYFRRVRPELQLRRQDAILQESVQRLNTELIQQRQQLQQRRAGSQMSGTGHTTYFMNYSGYYNFGRR